MEREGEGQENEGPQPAFDVTPSLPSSTPLNPSKRKREENESTAPNKKMKPAISVLPQELLLLVLSFVNAKDICTCCKLVCREWRHLSEDEFMWHLKFKRDLLTTLTRPSEFLKPEDKSWQWFYMSKLELKGDNGVGRKISTMTHTKVQEGDWKVSKLDGFGITFSEGNEYRGEYKEGKQHGFGSYAWKFGDHFSGEWFEDKRHGQGEYVWQSGDRYIGQWKEGEYEGIGTYIWVCGDKYIGNWVKSKQDGLGKKILACGSTYEGEWKDGNEHGRGVYIWNEGEWKGDKYEGEWKDGVRLGYGVYTWAEDGGQYTGHWVDNKRHLFGIQTSQLGRYEGEWKDDIKHGKGIYRWSDGDIYIGEWEEDTTHGYCHYHQ